MAIQLSETVRNALLDAISTTIAASPSLIIFSGAKPANIADADPSGVLATLALPATWMNAAATGSKTKTGTWSATASGTGTAQSFRIKQGATVHAQGTVGQGTGDLSLDNTSIAVNQVVTVSTFTLTAPNA